MKKILSFLFVATCFSVLVLSSCNKKSDPVPTKEQLLSRAAGWKQTAFTINGTDFFADFLACEKDNIYKFKQTGSTSGGTYTIDEGATKCDVADPQTVETGTWSFNNDKTILSVTSGAVTFPVTVVTLTTTTFSFTQQETDAGVTYTYVQTFTGL